MKKILSLSDVEHGRAANKFFSELFDEIYLVGGALRDEFLGLKSTDLDYCTPDNVEQIKAKLKGVGLPFLDHAERYGTISTNLGIFDIQITTYREEQYSKNDRRPRISNITDIDSDLSRRDFTINSMAVSLSEFVDPYDGYSDLENKIIRAVGDVEKRFEEDPLRILRAYRFVSQLGFEMSDKTLIAASKKSELVAHLSSARVGSELSKIIQGRYWADALLEMSESNVLTHALTNFNYSGEINPRLLQEKIDSYTLRQLEQLSHAERWSIFFGVVYDSKIGKSVSIRPSTKFVKDLGDWLELGKALITEIDESLDLLPTVDSHSNRALSRISQLRQEISETDKIHSPAHYRALSAALDFELARIEFRNSNFKSCRSLIEQSIVLTDINFQAMVDGVNPDLRNSKALRYKYIYFDRLKYLYACILMDISALEKYKTLDKITKQALSLNKIKTAFSVSKGDNEGLVEEAIVLIFKKTNKSYPIGNLDNFLTDVSNHISDERKYHLRKNNLYNIAHSYNSTSIEKRDAYENLMQLSRSHGISVQSEDYIELELDYSMANCLATKTISDFWHSYNLLDKVAYKVIKFDRTDSAKKSYLASASVLVYALTLDDTIEEKADISLMVISHYLMSGTSAGRRNAGRFRLYLDWFRILIAVKTISDIKKDLPLTIHNLRGIKSLGYIDEDEAYFNTELKELAQTRNNISLVMEFLNYIAGNVRTFTRGDNAPLTNISGLLDTRLISYDDAFKVFQNWCAIQSTTNLDNITFKNIEQVYSNNELEEKSENVAIIEKGESEHVEFKASFKYKIEAKMLDSTGQVPYSSVKTIASFLNTSGGKLFIGVSDNTVITGLEETDFKVLKTDDTVQKKVDIIKLQIDEMIDKYIGSHNTTNIIVTWEQFMQKTFIIVDVIASLKPIFCDTKFYIRTSSSCRELQGNEMLQYINDHFNK